MSNSLCLWTVPTRLPHAWNFPGKNTGAGWPFPTPRDPPDPGITPTPPAYPLLAGGFFITEPPGKAPWWITN